MKCPHALGTTSSLIIYCNHHKIRFGTLPSGGCGNNTFCSVRINAEIMECQTRLTELKARMVAVRFVENSRYGKFGDNRD